MSMIIISTLMIFSSSPIRGSVTGMENQNACHSMRQASTTGSVPPEADLVSESGLS